MDYDLRNQFLGYVAFHCQLSNQLAEYPQNRLCKTVIQKVLFYGHPVYNFLVTSLGILMLQPLLATPAEKSWMEEVS